jgi:hypothetical protein
MSTTNIDGYEIEFTAEPLAGTNEWGAYVAIFAPSDNPMHLANIYPRQRVAADVSFASCDDAEAAAQQAGLDALKQLREQSDKQP